MFSCNVCGKEFPTRWNLNRHAKSHDGVKFSCGICSLSFAQKAKLTTHVQQKHHLTKYGNEYNIAMGIRGNVAAAATMLGTPSNIPSASVIPPPRQSKIVSVKRKSVSAAARQKKLRIERVNTPGFTEIDSSLDRTIIWLYRKNYENLFEYRSFLRQIRPELIEKLGTFLLSRPIKYNLKLESTYCIPNSEKSPENRAFKTSARELYQESDIDSALDEDFTLLLSEEDAYMGKGSGFTLSRIDGILLGIYEYSPLGGSSYIPLPFDIASKKAVVNPQNIDECCFKWAILAKSVTDSKHHVGENYTEHEDKYNFSGIKFPTPLNDVKIFEKNNLNVSINVYGLKQQKLNQIVYHTVYPLRVSDEEKSDHFDLLLITDSEKSHYTYISNFSRLVRAQKTLHKEGIIFCKRCFTSFDNRPLINKLHGQEALEQHKLICGHHKPVLPVMPAEGSTLQFDSWCKTQRLPFVLFADFEALLIKFMQKLGMNTEAFQSHKPMSYGFIVVASDDVPTELFEQFNIPRGPVIFRGSEERDQVAKEFVAAIVEVADKIRKLLKTVNKPIVMSQEERKAHVEKTHCDLCKSAFNVSYHKVADHHHLSGKFRQTLCNRCNLQLKTQHFIPCFMHNLSSYDAHFIVTELGYDKNTISVIPNSEEKYISFSKYISNDFSVRFVDTYRFMASSLSSLAENLMTDNFSKFHETIKVFSRTDLPLVTRKGVYPYEYTDSWARLDETCLPPKSDFYSTLTETDVSDEDYEHAVKVWEHFGCRTLGEYSDLYLKIDVLLLADVFENFRDVCLKTYNLDPAWYFTAPGFSFDCMLKYTHVKLQLLDEYDMLLMFEKGIRGGLTQASMRYAKANNKKTPGFNETKPKSWIIYQDCNNLYGWAMSQYMPYGGFQWADPDEALSKLDSMCETSDVGRMYEVDISYPSHLHDAHNDLPFLPENGKPPGSSVCKLMATFLSKERYVVHYLNLKQAIAHGLKVEKVHRVLEFQQSPWLAKYISLNTEMRKQATNEFEKNFFKLMNNAVFGKTMENTRKRMQMELVSSPNRLRKLVKRSTFKYCTTYNENLSAVMLHNKIIEFNKPIYIGFAVLEVSKTLMFDYHYNVMKAHYKDNINLMYTDTDSLVYHIATEDFYADLKNNSILLDRMDTANLPQDHPCYLADRKKVPGYFSDETDGQIMYEFIALRAKSYAFDVEGKEKIKAKGIRGHVVKNHMTFEQHKQCLFANPGFNPYRQNVSIRSFSHQLSTIKSNKLTYNSYDDKRYVLEDRIHTLAHGHYHINELEEEAD